MKKKIALLLAGVMAMSTLPMTSFAATSNTVNNAKYISSDVADVPVSVYSALTTQNVPADITLDYATNNPSTKGSVDFVVSNGDWESNSGQFAVLVNAYMPHMPGNTDTEANWMFTPAEIGELAHAQDIIEMADKLKVEVAGSTTDQAVSASAKTRLTNVYSNYLSGSTVNKLRNANQAIANTNIYMDEAAVDVKFEATIKGIVDSAATNTNGQVYNALEAAKTAAETVKNGLYVNSNKIAFQERPIYTDTATVRIPKGVVGSVAVPIFFEIDSKTSNVTVSIKNIQANASAGTFTVGQVVSGGTLTYIDGADSNRSQTQFDIITKETTADRLTAGTHRVVYSLPSGFNFISVGGKLIGTGEEVSSDQIKVILSNGTEYTVNTGNSTSYGNPSVTVDLLTDKMNLNSAASSTYAKVGYTNSTSRSMVVDYYIGSRATGSASELGAIKLADVIVAPEFGSNKFGDILMDVTSKSFNGSTAKTFITNQTDLKVGSYVDWGVTLTAADSDEKIPTLVSGRLEGNVNLTNDIQKADKDVFVASQGSWSEVGNMKLHQTIKVKFQEVVPNSWWAGRETEFTVPEGVNILKVEFTKVENIQSANGAGNVLDGQTIEFDDKYNDVNGVKNLSNYVNIKGNKLTLQNLEVFDKAENSVSQATQVKQKAKIEMILWVASDVNFEGDIALTLGGNAVVDQVDPLTIATTVVPYKVDTQVTNVEIGLQSYDVADITIAETELGRFATDEKIYLDIVDGLDINGISNVGVDIRDAKVEVVEGDLEIDRYAVDAQKGLMIDIKSSSSKSKPSTIKVSNVTITLDRTVPQTNKEPLQLVISSDYRSNVAMTSNEQQSIRFGSLNADYIHVKTLITGNTTGTTVAIKAGETTALVNGVETELDAPAFIANNSLMIPLRFVSVATGIDKEDVIWDPINRTATIISGEGRIVQFTDKSTNHTINGTSLPNANDAKAEIKNSRMFVPFRTLGYALNIPVSWDEATSTALFN